MRVGTRAEAPPAVVAVVRSDNRRGAVAEALALLGAEIRSALAGPAVVLAPIGRGRRDSAHPGALSALLDAVLAAGVGSAAVVSGHPRAADRFDRLGLAGECWGRPAPLLDLGRDEARWEPIGLGGGPPARLSGTVGAAGCRVALVPISALRRAPAVALATREAFHPADRSRYDGRPIAPAGPDLLVVEGPIGWRGRSTVAVAGLDPSAVEAVAAAVRGRGAIDPGRVEIVGDAVGPIRPTGPTPSPAPGLRVDPGHGGLDRGAS